MNGPKWLGLSLGVLVAILALIAVTRGAMAFAEQWMSGWPG